MSQRLACQLIEIANPTKRVGLLDDEFSISLNGHTIGAFKDFALPCIHMLEGKSESEWRNQSEKALYRSMERARLFCQQADVALWRWMKSHPLPESAIERFVELARRLRLAFKLQAPFYHLEREAELYAGATGGDLDLALMMLPSAFKTEVVASEGIWVDSWSAIRRRTLNALTQGLKRHALLRLSALAEVPLEYIVFAANSLEFIPGRPGGKTTDVSEQEALSALTRLSIEPRGLGDLNAKIRFENFLPLIECVENFSGKSWRYASVCETSNDLLQLVTKHPELWRQEFRKEFFSEVLPQLGFLDATSPKGRLLLEFIEQGKGCVSVSEDTRWEKSVVARLKFARMQKVGMIRPRSEIGGKGFGLAIAKVAGHPILPGWIITSPAIRDSRRFDLRNLPRNQRWAVRSSALDEGVARGVYESYLNIGSASLRGVIERTANSFFAQKAKNFRKLSGTGDEMEIAVILEKYRRLKGGVIQGGNIHRGSTAAMVTSGKGSLVELGSHDLLSIFPNGQIEFQDDGVSRLILQLEFGECEKTILVFPELANRKEVWVKSTKELLALLPEENTAFVLRLETGMTGFDSALMAWIASHGPRIAEIRHPNPPGGGSHLANLCRYFGIKLI